MHTLGSLPSIGKEGPEATLTGIDLGRVKISDFRGKKVVLNVFPSVDTNTCATSVRKFNQEATRLENTAVLCISRDLPYAQRRFCGAEDIDNVVMLSDFPDGEFGEAYGLPFTDSVMRGLLSRAVVVLDEKGVVHYTEQVADTGSEPNYEAALEALK